MRGRAHEGHFCASSPKAAFRAAAKEHAHVVQEAIFVLSWRKSSTWLDTARWVCWRLRCGSVGGKKCKACLPREKSHWHAAVCIPRSWPTQVQCKLFLLRSTPRLSHGRSFVGLAIGFSIMGLLPTALALTHPQTTHPNTPHTQRQPTTTTAPV